MLNTAIVGTGSYLPDVKITNKDLEGEFIDGPGSKIFTDKWISTNFGIKERCLAYDYRTGEKKELNSDMATKAVQSAIENAGIKPNEIDMLICSTATPDKPLPPMVLTIQENLGIEECACMETRSACSGLSQGIIIGNQLVKSGEYKTIAIVGSEFTSAFYEVSTYGSSVDPYVNRVMFGDGAGAFILKGVEPDRGGIIATTLNSVGFGKPPGISMPFGGSEQVVRKAEDASIPYFNQNFRAIYKSAPALFERALAHILDKANLKASDVDYFIPHQASISYMKHLSEVFEIPEEKMIVDLDKVGNTGSASIFIALDHVNKKKYLKDGDILVLLPAEATKWVYGGVALKWVA
ncbi:MAG: 3-oxoacyl-ACP synthase III family protein [Bacteroidales bacterium]|nr:3-oxoacyl-ACP synthase III family protein [Bacteroidales bacterium]